jgi:hypothetical protein
MHTHHQGSALLGQEVKQAVVKGVFYDVFLYEMLTFVFQTSVKMKLVCQQVVKSLLGEDIDVSWHVFSIFCCTRWVAVHQICMMALVYHACF